MRLRTWLAYVAMLATGLSSPAAADDPHGGIAYDPGAVPFVDPGAQYCPPGGYGAPGGYGPPGGYGMPDGGGFAHDGLNAMHAASVPMGSGFAPYPAVSPFESHGEQHRWADGMWVKDLFPRGEMYSRISATLMSGRQPHKSPIVAIGDGVPAGTFLGPSTVISNLAFEDDPDPLSGRDGGNQERDKNRSTPGIRAVLGWIRPAGNIIEVNAWFTPGGTAYYQRGLGSAGPAVPAVTHVLPVTPGGFITYDQLFRIQWQSVYGGGGANLMTTDMWPSPNKSLRVMYGMRYVYVNEEFGFFGADRSTVIPFRTELNSRVTSNLVGPQVGLDYSFGGDTFKITGQSKAGAMLNFTEYELSGIGMGSPTLNGAAFNPTSAFSDSEDHAHLTPLFEQAVDLDMDLVPILPFLKRSALLKNSKIHVGYWVVLGWQMGRPHNVIDWQVQPLNPVLEPHLAARRTQWYTHGWKFGFTSTW